MEQRGSSMVATRKTAKSEVLMMRGLRNLYYSIRYWRMRRTYLRRTKQMRQLG
jgi:hypothetical protein